MTRIVAITNSKGIPGTGCIGYLRKSGQPIILSNWHVLFGKGAVKGDKVWQVVESEQKQRLHETGSVISGKIGNIWFHNWEVYVDCAISTCTACDSPAFVNSSAIDAPVLKGCGEAGVGDIVFKIGAGTGLTKGIVVDNRYADQAAIEGKILAAKNQLLIRSENGQPFSAQGDSGSLVFNRENQVVGLLWGTNGWGEGLACPIAPVMTVLDIDFDTIDK
jgi:hypothetical protein